MAIPGQRFELDLEAENFTFNHVSDDIPNEHVIGFGVRDVQEHDLDGDAPPPAPSVKSSHSGFPAHKSRPKTSAFKSRSQAAKGIAPTISATVQPSDQAIRHRVGHKYGVDMDAQQKADISEENKRRLDQMSVEDIEEARAELTRSLNPAFLQRLLKRANIDEDQIQSESQSWPTTRTLETNESRTLGHDHQDTSISNSNENSADPLARTDARPEPPAFHFPVPPRSTDEFKPLNPDDPSFLADLKTHYFPNTPHDPSSLSWLQDPSEEENADSLYNPSKESFVASAIRFDFKGRLIPPKESLEIHVKEGLHHHGDDPNSAGYTVPELALLARSTLPNQRCMAYQVLGRILYRLGRGDFGARGSELQEAIWSVVEKERPIEVIMSEANRQSGHASAKAHAVEALWLWRKGGGGDRGVLKPGQRLAK